MKILVACVLALLLVGCRDGRVLQPTLALPRPGSDVPAFDYPTPEGGRVQSSALGDAPTVLFLWSTHCPTSRLALTAYRELLHTYRGRGVRLVMLSDDRSDAELSLLPKVLADSSIRGEVALARGQLGRAFDQSRIAPERDTARVEFVLPAYLVVSPNGRILARSWGPDQQAVRRALDSLRTAQRLTGAPPDSAAAGR